MTSNKISGIIGFILGILLIVFILGCIGFATHKIISEGWYEYVEVEIRYNEDTQKEYYVYDKDSDRFRSKEYFKPQEKANFYYDNNAPINNIHRAGYLMIYEKDDKLYVRKNPFQDFFGG